jgi:hypothetical protein
MISLAERDRIIKQTIVDFIDAETTDDACLKLIESIEKIQPFSSHFVEKARGAFPLLSNYTALPKNEKMLFDLFHEENKLLTKVGGTLAFIMANLISYDPVKKTLTYIITPTIDPMNSKNVDFSEPKEELISDLEKKLKKELSLLGDIYPEYEDWSFREAYELVKVGKGMLDLKKTITESRYADIKRLSEIYSKVLSGHKKIQEHQGDLKKIMDEVVNGKISSESNKMNDFIDDYNNSCNVAVRLSPAGYLFNAMTFPTEDNFITLNIAEEADDGPWFEPYRIATIFCLIEYFRSINT